MSWTAIRQRLLAFGLGTGLVLAGLWGSFIVLILGAIGAQPPDPRAPDFGDPCCPVPDTWLGVAGWLSLALVAAAADTAVLTLGAAFLFFAVRHRWPSRRIARAVLYGPLVWLGLFALLLAWRLASG